MSGDQEVLTITLFKAVPGHAPGDRKSFIAGSNHVDERGRRYVRLGLEDSNGERDVEVLEGSTFEFAGATWEVSEVHGPSTADRGVVARLTKVKPRAE